MPVKWTSEMDQLLLLKILETCEVNADAKKISAAWPTDCANGLPTPRAITERLVKIREAAKKSGAGHFNIPSARSKGTGTPRKPRATAGVTTPGSGSNKRKRTENMNGNGMNDHGENEDDEEDFERVKVPKVEEDEDVFWMGSGSQADIMNGNRFNHSLGDEDCAGVEESPRKHAKREGIVMVDGYGSDGTAGGESSVSDFVDVA